MSEEIIISQLNLSRDDNQVEIEVTKDNTIITTGMGKTTAEALDTVNLASNTRP